MAAYAASLKHRHGLLHGSYVPSPAIRDLRDLTRTRATLSQEQSSISSRIQKLLESANIKLASTVSNTMDKSGRAIPSGTTRQPTSGSGGCCCPLDHGARCRGGCGLEPCRRDRVCMTQFPSAAHLASRAGLCPATMRVQANGSAVKAARKSMVAPDGLPVCVGCGKNKELLSLRSVQKTGCTSRQQACAHCCGT